MRTLLFILLMVSGTINAQDQRAYMKDLYARSRALWNSDPETAKLLADSSLLLAKELGDLRGQYMGHFSSGVASFYQAAYPNALRSFMTSLELAKKLNNDSLIASAYNSIGNVYNDLEQYNKAIPFFLDAIQVREKFENKQLVADVYANIGNSYINMGNADSGQYYYDKAYAIALEVNDSNNIANYFGSMGSISEIRKDYHAAIRFTLLSSGMHKRLGDTINSIGLLTNVAGFYKHLKMPDSSIYYYTKCIEVAARNGFTSIEMESYRMRSNAYQETGRFKEAFEDRISYEELNQEVFNEEADRNLKDMSEKYQSEKKQEQIRQLEESRKNQAMFNQLLIVIVILALLSAIAFFYMYRGKKKTNILLHEKSQIIETAYKDIQDSIRYAKRIQSALLPDAAAFYRRFPSSFILYMPKDVVSGDFYWFAEVGEVTVVAAADCTGHGVPGAFMSMLGSEALNKVVKERGIISPREILFHVNKEMRVALKQDKELEGLRDGMDVALLVFHRNKNQIVFSGANRPLFTIRNNEILVTKATKQAIGAVPEEMSNPFEEHVLSCVPGDQYYIFSDGFADQFGGSESKKLMVAGLKKLLLESSSKEPQVQKTFLEEQFKDWKGALEQVDDVLVIGVRV